MTQTNEGQPVQKLHLNNQSAGMFIASKLRGIPLVWGAGKRPETKMMTIEATSTTTTTSKPQGPATQDSSNSLGKMLSIETDKAAGLQSKELARKSLQVGKRDIQPSWQDERQLRAGQRIQGHSEVLFKSGAATASTSNWLRPTSTTVRSQQQISNRRTTSVTTSRKPLVANGTRRVSTSAIGGSNKKISANNNGRSIGLPAIGSSQTSEVTQPMVIATTTMRSPMPPLAATTTTSTTTTTPIGSTTTTEPSVAGPDNYSLNSASKQVLSSSSSSATTSKLNMATRTSQSLTTQPVNQRRAQQTVVSQRFSNRPNNHGQATVARSAGENWILFNRPDGSFSTLEWLVLFSNVMIVSAILLIVFVNWFKAHKSRRQRSNGPEPSGTSSNSPASVSLKLGTKTMPLAPNGSGPDLQLSDRASKLSIISSGGLSQLSSNAGGGASSSIAMDQVQDFSVSKQQLGANGGPNAAMITSNYPKQQSNVQQQQKLSSANKIFNNEFKTANVANKAMAIVQPTESQQKPNQNAGQLQLVDSKQQQQQQQQRPTSESNTSKVDELKAELMDSTAAIRTNLDELGNQLIRPISRSISDLSGGTAKDSKQQQPVKASADDLGAIKVTRGSTGPDNDDLKTQENRVRQLERLFNEPTTKDRSEPTNGVKSKLGDKRQASASSLESIELPEQLIESIRGKNGRKTIHEEENDDDIAPSPNLLLGETTGLGSGKKVGGAATKPETEFAPVVSKGGDQKLVSNIDKSTKPTTVAASMTDDSRKTNSKMAAAEKNPITISSMVLKQQPAKSNASITSAKPEPNKPASLVDKGEQKISQETTKSINNQQDSLASIERPENPMGKQLETAVEQQLNSGANAANSNVNTTTSTSQMNLGDMAALGQQSISGANNSEIKNHQVVVNKLDKRKTNLEIVDLRDESVATKVVGNKSALNGTKSPGGDSAAWISMDGVAVVQAANQQFVPTSPGIQQQQQQQQILASASQTPALMSPSEIIESRFHVDYSNKSKQQQRASGSGEPGLVKRSDTPDSKTEESRLNNIENELELDNKMKNRKYFVYIVHDGHFSAKKECIARIELPPKRRITLAELRQLISSSQDVSLSSLRRNRFKFVTETYRLLNENEDAAILHQVYPTQGVFLKLNVAEQENSIYPFKTRTARLSSGSGGVGGIGGSSSSLNQTTIASRRRATNRSGPGQRQSMVATNDGLLPAIEVDYATGESTNGRNRASSVGRPGAGASGGRTMHPRSRSSVQQATTRRNVANASDSGGRSRQQTSSGSTRRGQGSQVTQRGSIKSKFPFDQDSNERLPSIDLDDLTDEELIKRRRSLTGMPLADMSDDRMRIKPRWKIGGL